MMFDTMLAEARARKREAFAQGDRARREQLAGALVNLANALGTPMVSHEVEIQAAALIALWNKAGPVVARTAESAAKALEIHRKRAAAIPA